MASWLAATLSVLAGGFLTMISNWIADNRLNERERERRREERRDRRSIRRDDFQRETLLALQSASQRLLRTGGRMLHYDSVAFRETGRWQRRLFGDDLSNEQFQLNAETGLLASRVLDDETRALTQLLRERVTSASFSPNEETAESRMRAAADTHQALIERTGELIRELDIGE